MSGRPNRIGRVGPDDSQGTSGEVPGIVRRRIPVGESAMVVHGNDGLDEITTTTTTSIWELREGSIATYELDPRNYGIELTTKEALKGGSPDFNAQIIKNIFSGKEGPKTDIVLLNAGAACYITGISDNIEEGIEKAKQALKSGKAKETLNKLIEVSNK